MANVNVAALLNECAKEVEASLATHVQSDDRDIKEIFDAQAYSLLGGGKRIRPYLVMTFCQVLQGNKEKALPLACALEMIHTYSLIHDDLPCMDDDEYRRGRLTNHKVFGEATAVLAGDALLTKAFSVVAKADLLSAEEKIAAIDILSSAAGDLGMIGGQVMDMGAEACEEPKSLSYLIKMHEMKTGALIKAAAQLGCLAAGQLEDKGAIATAYAANIGLAFQVVDDILDVTSDVETLGKNVGVDDAQNKLTFMRFYSVESAGEYARELTNKAIEAVREIDRDGELCALAQYLLNRKY